MAHQNQPEDDRPSPIDDSIHTAGTAELQPVVEQVLSEYFGLERQIDRLERRPSAKRSSYALDELDVRLADGTRLELIVKDVGRRGLLEEARAIKPAFLFDPLREIETYRTILAPNPSGTAICYGISIAREAQRYWLFLERVPGVELYYVGHATWRQAVRWLARMHSAFSAQIETLTRARHLLRYDREFYALWPRRAAIFLRQAHDEPSHRAYREIARLARRYEPVVERLLALPATFIHGEFYASNVLVQTTGPALRICPVDWEMAAIGPGLIDLAALCAGSWTADEQAVFAQDYYDIATAGGWWRSSLEAFLTALDCCRLHLAMQWLGWSSRWTPPPEHAQDWLGEALSLAKRLGL